MLSRLSYLYQSYSWLVDIGLASGSGAIGIAAGAGGIAASIRIEATDTGGVAAGLGIGAAGTGGGD